MSHLVIASNVQSPLLSGLVAVSQEDVSYTIRPSAPLLAKNTKIIQSRNPVVGAPASKEVVIDITRQGFLREMQIQTVFTLPAVSATGNLGLDALQKVYLGLNMYSEVNLRTANKVLVPLSDFYIRCRPQDSEVNKSVAIHDRALIKLRATETRLPDAGAQAAGVEFVTYTPVFSPFTENDIHNLFNLRQYESLSLSCRFNTNERMGLPVNHYITGAQVFGVISTVEYDDRTYKLILAENSALDRPTQFYGYGSVTERESCKPATNINSIKIPYDYPMTKTYTGVLDGAAPVASASGANLKPVTNVMIKINGEILLDTMPTSCVNYEVDQYGGSAGITCPSGPATVTSVQYMDATQKAVVIRWGMDANNTYCSGAFALVGANSVQIFLTTAANTTVDDYIIYSAQVANIINFDNVSSTASVITTS